MWTEEFSEGTHFVACCLQLRYDIQRGTRTTSSTRHAPSDRVLEIMNPDCKVMLGHDCEAGKA